MDDSNADGHTAVPIDEFQVYVSRMRENDDELITHQYKVFIVYLIFFVIVSCSTILLYNNMETFIISQQLNKLHNLI